MINIMRGEELNRPIIRASNAGGYSLLEVMVAVGLIALTVASFFVMGSDFKWISHETDYQNALRLLKINEKAVSQKGYSFLPPESTIIPANGKVQLNNAFIVPGSVTVIPEGEGIILSDDYRVDHRRGIISFIPGDVTGKKVVIKYSFYLPDLLETCRIPGSKPFEVEPVNTPVECIMSMSLLIDGDTRYPVSPDKFRLEKGRGKIAFTPSMRGRVVQIQYLGKKIRNICSGKFVDPGLLTETDRDTGMKLITVREIYGSGGNTLETIQFRSK